MPKIQLPLNDIGGENSFFEHRANILNVFKEEPVLKLFGYSPEEEFNYIWCNLAQYFYIRGEKYQDMMKYFILAERGGSTGYLGTAIYIHPDFAGESRAVMAQALIEFAAAAGIKNGKIASYTARPVKVFERLFRKMGAKHDPSGDFISDLGFPMQKYTMNIGEDFEEAYCEIISTCQGHTKEKR